MPMLASCLQVGKNKAGGCTTNTGNRKPEQQAMAEVGLSPAVIPAVSLAKQAPSAAGSC